MMGTPHNATTLYDPGGEPVSFYTDKRGNKILNIHDSHVHEEMFNHDAVYFPGTATATTAQSLKNTRTITVASMTGITIGSFLDIQQGAVHVHQFRKVVSIVGLLITLDSYLDKDVGSGSTVQFADFSMNKNASAADPVIFAIPPVSGEVVHLNRMQIVMSHAGVPDDGKFGGITALENGITLRINYGNGTSYDTITNWKTNQDLKLDMFDVIYTDAAPAGENGTACRFTVLASGSVIRLDGSNGDKLEYLIQDDLSGLSGLEIRVQGHYE